MAEIDPYSRRKFSLDRPKYPKPSGIKLLDPELYRRFSGNASYIPATNSNPPGPSRNWYKDSLFEYHDIADQGPANRSYLDRQRELRTSRYGNTMGDPDSWWTKTQTSERGMFARWNKHANSRNTLGLSPPTRATALKEGFQSAAGFTRSRFLQSTGHRSLTAAAFAAKGKLPGIAGGAALMSVVSLATSGEPLSVGSALHAFGEGTLMDLSFRLAGGMASGFGWSAIGAGLGLGSGGTLGLMAGVWAGGNMIAAGAGSALVGSMGTLAFPAAAAYGLGRGAYALTRAAYQTGANSRRADFSTGDMSFASSGAATMRQRALGAIQNSQMNARAMLGNEASTYARAVGY